jgi:hypothetical protein
MHSANNLKIIKNATQTFSKVFFVSGFLKQNINFNVFWMLIEVTLTFLLGASFGLC